MQNSEELAKWLLQYQISDDLAGTEQSCMICSTKFTVRKSGLPPRYGVCKRCKCSFTSKNRTITEEQKQLQKSRALNTWNSKSSEEKQRIINQRKETLKQTCANRTEEEHKRIGENISNVQKNFSEEKKETISLKKQIAQKDYWDNLSAEDRSELRQKNKVSHNTEDYKQKRKLYENNLTKEQKQLRSQRSSEILKKTWLQKGPELLRSIQDTKAGWSVEKRLQIAQKQVQTKLTRTETEKQKSLQKFRNTWAQKSEEEIRQIRSKAVHRYIYDGEYFDSSWELALWIYAKDHNEDIERCPTVLHWTLNNKQHDYFPDSKYKGQLVEVKGDHFFKLNGDLYNPFDASLDEAMKTKQLCMLENDVKVFRSKEMQRILDYIEDKYTLDYLELFRKDLPFPYPKLPKYPNDFDLIRHFHKSLYEATRKDKVSPLVAWQNKELIKKSALNRLKYVGKCTPEAVLQGFNVAKIAPKVSVFKPSLAERLINTYLTEYSTIFDPFSGFSGRMIGTVNCNKAYIGQDIHTGHVKESNEIIEYKKYQNVKIIEQNILTDSQKTYDCLFTCPPYGGKEHWNENNDEIEKSCDEWIDICLAKYTCKRYLFVVDTTEKYKDKIVETLENRSHLGVSKEYVILL